MKMRECPSECGPRRQTHFGKNLLRINLKSGLFSVAVYTPNSDPISDVHWLVRRKIGSAVRGCAKLVDIRTCIENDRLVTSLVYCAIYAQLLVLRPLGGASYRTGIILVVVRMAAPLATTSNAVAHLVTFTFTFTHMMTRTLLDVMAIVQFSAKYLQFTDSGSSCIHGPV